VLDNRLGNQKCWLGTTHEIDTDGRDVGLGIGVIGESQEKTRLSNTGVSDEEELEEIVVSSWCQIQKLSRSRISTAAEKGNRMRFSRGWQGATLKQ
jgi:hypothetical protein